MTKKKTIEQYFAGYKEIFTVAHGSVSFKLSYNPKPMSKTDYWRLDIHPFAGDDIRLLLCREDIGALLVLFGFAIKKIPYGKL